MILDEKQILAVEKSVAPHPRITAITGAAGTGKTTVIKAIVDEIASRGQIIEVCAPTGKAARRVTEATGKPAVTLHKLLEYPRPGERDPETGKALVPTEPRRCRANPIIADYVLCDEYAMVNNTLDRNLLDALKTGAKLIVVGDMYQLPPIEEYKVKTVDGTPFERHLKRDSVVLENVYRQGEDSDILAAATRIKQGIVPMSGATFKIKKTSEPVKVLEDYVISCMDHGIMFNSIENQIITAIKKGWVGAPALNQMLQRLYNWDNLPTAKKLSRHTWDKENPIAVAEGDKVICTENMYDLRDYHSRYREYNDRELGVEDTYIPPTSSEMMLNGEVGIVKGFTETDALIIDFGDREVIVEISFNEYSWKKDDFYPRYPQRSIDLGYALTTHKCQGSEFKEVVYVTSKTRTWGYNRKNFYTAVTRAKEYCSVITDDLALRRLLEPSRD